MGLLGSIAGAGIGAISNANQGRKNRDWQTAENEKGRQWQAEQNQLGRDFQKHMLKAQQEFAERMYNENNAWNSANSQVARLRDAGINPAVAFSGGSFGSASSQPSSSGTPSAFGSSNPYQSSSLPYSTSHVAPIVNSLADYFNNKEVRQAQVNKVNKEAENMSIKNLTEYRRNLAELAGKEHDNTYKKLVNDNLPHLQRLVNDKTQMEIDNIEEQKKLTTARIFAQDIENKYADKNMAASLANMYADTRNKLVSADLSEQQRRKVVYDTINSQYQSEVTRIESQFRGKQRQHEIDNLQQWKKESEKRIPALIEAAEKARKDNNWYAFKEVTTALKDILVGAGGAAVTYTTIKGARGVNSPTIVPSGGQVGYPMN